ncbi:docking protein 3 [Brienomyrus brachyistius]|uniref:docking protein 3 n=1 Tax=Brienomyrus brachyistius TaxID=42636 RepID=UPI0020B3C894|nr:docking protein 3 [Brienomyrus brachyistius]
MEVPAKEGALYLQVVKFGKKNWKRIWMMLFPASSSGIGRVELYVVRDGQMKPGIWKAGRRVIRLADCLSICPALEESCPPDHMAFYLNTTQRTYALAAESHEDWVSRLCQLAFQWNDGNQKWSRKEEMLMEENELYSSWKTVQYKVTIQRTEAAVRCNLSGSYLLSLSNDAISLLDPVTSQTIYDWPYPFLRRYGQDKDTITIEAGRRCHSGEGHFTFLSKDVAQIYKSIEEVITSHSATSAEPKASSKPPTTKASGKTRDQMDSLPSCPDKTLPAVSPRNVVLPDVTGKLPPQQASYPQAIPETMEYSVLQIPTGDRQSYTVLRTKNEQEWLIEEAKSDWEEEERLCSLESICLDDTIDDAFTKRPPLNYKAAGCLDEGDLEKCSSSECQNSVANSQSTGRKENSEEGSASHLSQTTPIVTTTEIPVDFKERLSNILFKDLAKVQAPLCIKYTDTAKTFCYQDKVKEELGN